MTRSFNPRFRIKQNYLAAVSVTAAPLIYFLPALLQHRVLCPDDGLLQNVPFRVAAAQIIRSGHLPLWDPYIFSGMPLLATAQVGILYPLNWFFLTFSAATATNLMVIATYMVAGLGAYLYARRTSVSVVGAVITALAWQFGGAAIGQISHINIVQTAVLLPWVLWSVERYADKGRVRNGALISGLLAVQFFAGHQQAFVNSLLLVSAYLVVMFIANRELRRRYLAAFAFIATGLLLAAIQILPTYELLRRSERSAATYEFFTSFSLPKRFILAFVAPYVMGGGDGRLFRAPYVGPPFYAEMAGYVGVITIMLALVALLIKPDVRTKFWAAVGMICLLLAFGGFAPLYIYKLIYYVPLLNLFRVPARHLMEVDFALAVLAGRGFTVLRARRSSSQMRLVTAFVVAAVVLFTVIAVTILRPAEFHLARAVPTTFLRAPELFIPVLLAAMSACAVWRFSRARRGATAFMLGVLVLDLALWGQSSGWFVGSPRSGDEYFHEPEIVQMLNQVAPGERSSFRVLTAPHQFDPAVAPVPPSVSHSPDWVLWTQPDIYMMHGIQNAAGYDGFGLERYSQLAGRMKVWGELTDPDTSLRSGSREIDLANVRYLISMRKQSGSDTLAGVFAKPEQTYGDYRFAANDLGISSLSKDKQLSFSVPPVEIDGVALVTQLSWSENVPNNTPVAVLRLRFADGHTSDLQLRAGVDTSEWSYDRPDIRARIRHSRGVVANSYQVSDTQGSYDAHTYITVLALPGPAKITGGEFLLKPDPGWPDLGLTVFRVSLLNNHENKTYALTRDMFSIDHKANEPGAASNRWKRLTQTPYVEVFENGTAMPRAWLASQTRVLDQTAMLEVIRTGRFADGLKWDPGTTALLEGPPAGATPAGSGMAEITRYEPNRIEVNTKSDAPSILVLSENHYPGWRAYVDGQFVETLRVDYNLRGAALPAGEHKVEFVYRPKSVFLGATVSLVALALLGAAVMIDRKFKGGQYHSRKRME
jgi:hypothetical protein